MDLEKYTSVCSESLKKHIELLKASKSIVTKTKQTAIINSLLQRFKKRNDQDIDEKLDQVRSGNLSIFCAALDKIVCKRTMKQVMKEVEK